GRFLPKVDTPILPSVAGRGADDLHERNGLLEIRDRVRYRGRLVREPAVQLEPLRGEDPERFPALTEQRAAFLPCPHPRSPRGRTRKARATASNRGFWALGARGRDARARERLIRPLAYISATSRRTGAASLGAGPLCLW